MSDQYGSGTGRPTRGDEHPTRASGDEHPTTSFDDQQHPTRAFGDQQHPSRAFGDQPPPSDSYPSFTERDDRRPDSPWGSPDTSGDQRAGHDSGGAPVAVAERPRRQRRGLTSGVAALLAAGLIGGSAGGGVGYLLAEQNDSPSSASAPLTAPVVQAADTSDTQTQVVAVAASVTPSVVQISVRSGQTGGTGSGAIINSDGTIVTNNHVVEAAADGGSIVVSFSDGTTAPAEIVGRDEVTDLAVIRADTDRQLQAINLGDSSTLRVGQTVVALGSPLGLSGTVTQGIVSALNRPVSSSGEQESGQQPTATTINALQTDAPINPGNSGGPLVDLSGRLIGLNSAIASLGGAGGQSGSIGLGFAIPVNQLKPVVEQLAKGEAATHAQMGVTINNHTSSDGLTNGAEINSLTSPSGAAATAGLRVGDIITRVNTTPVIDAESLVATVRAARPGDEVTVTYLRGNRSATAQVKLGSD